MRPLQKLVIWERLDFPKISTPEPPIIVYYRATRVSKYKYIMIKIKVRFVSHYKLTKFKVMTITVCFDEYTVGFWY